jgi:uncharacterized membrane protein
MLLLHLLAVVVWVGGMFFAHVCLRPAAVATLLPPQRLPLMAAALARFFVAVAWSLLLLWGSGIAMFGQLAASGGRAPLSWHLMATIGLVMTGVFLAIWRRGYPRLKTAIESGEFKQAGTALDGIRRLVVLNLVLGVVTIAVATVGRLAN